MNSNDPKPQFNADQPAPLHPLEEPRTVRVFVGPRTGLEFLARKLADQSRSGARIVMYPLTPFD